MNQKNTNNLSNIITFFNMLSLVILFLFKSQNIFNFLGEAIILIGGIIYLKSEQKKRKEIILLLGLITLPFNFISGVFFLLLFTTMLNFQESKLRGSPVKPEIKRIDLLLKLGVFMVVLAGLMFSLSSWKVVPDIFQVLILLLIAITFLVLSSFSEKNLKIMNTTKLYFICSLGFILLSYLTISNLQILGPQFVFGKEIFNGLLFVLLSSILQIYAIKFNKENLKIGSVLFLFIGILYFVNYLAVPVGIIYMFINLFIIVLNLKDKKNNLFLKILSYLMIIATIGKFEVMNVYLNLGNMCLLVLNLLVMLKDKKTYNLNAILINLVIVSSSLFFNNKENIIIAVIILSSLHILLLLTKFIKNNKNFYKPFLISNLFIMIVLFIIGVDTARMIIAISLIVSHIVYLLTFYKEDKIKLNIRFEPVYIALCLIGSYYFLTKHGIFSNVEFLTISYLVFALFNIQTKNNKFPYFLLFIATFLLTFERLFVENNILCAAIFIIYSIFLYIFSTKSKDKLLNSLKNEFFIFIFIAIYFLFNIFPILNIDITLNNLLTLILFGLLSIINKQSRLAPLSIFIPFYTLLGNLTIDHEILMLLEIISLVSFVIIMCCKVIKKDKTKNLFSSISLFIILTLYLLGNSLLVSLFISMICLIMIAYSFINPKVKYIFYTGILVTVFNLFYQLRNIWSMIPFWLYVLIIGLAIIILITLKQSKHKE
ncbi:MAG: hypothetical protein RR557_02845 [Bacilli bacterium]